MSAGRGSQTSRCHRRHRTHRCSETSLTNGGNRRKLELAPNTQADYRWRLEVHLLPTFGETPIDLITVDAVERYASAKLAAGLSPRSVNMTLTTLGAILQSAVKRKLVDRNEAREAECAKERKPPRSYLETAGQVQALLEAAGRLDAAARGDRKHVHRRAMVATLTFAGLRIGEMLALRWRDVDLAGGWLTVPDAKTPAGVRKVKIRGALRDELLTVKADASGDLHAYVFPTSTGKQFGSENFRNRILAVAVTNASEHLAERDLPPLPDKLTPHSLRRTFASLLYALGETPPVVMAEMGHADARLALNVYAQVMRYGGDELNALAAVVDGAGFGPIRSDGLSGVTAE